MPPASGIQEFPPGFVVERTLELGFGSGPWSRRDLERRWTPSTANKYIQDAKKAGWLLSPFAGEFYVPVAQDLTVIPWLPTDRRLELITARTLEAAGMRPWCLSAWLRERGVVLRSPLFVVDLSGPRDVAGAEPGPSGIQRIASRIRERATALRGLPCEESIVVVPSVPLGPGAVIQMRVLLGSGVAGRPGAAPRSADVKSGESTGSGPTPRGDPGRVSYPLGPGIADEAWIAALLIALGIPRLRELVREWTEAGKGAKGSRQSIAGSATIPFDRRVRNWSAMIGDPAPNAAWKEELTRGLFPFLLVPGWLWEEISRSRTAARDTEISRTWRRAVAGP